MLADSNIREMVEGCKPRRTTRSVRLFGGVDLQLPKYISLMLYCTVQGVLNTFLPFQTIARLEQDVKILSG